MLWRVSGLSGSSDLPRKRSRKLAKKWVNKVYAWSGGLKLSAHYQPNKNNLPYRAIYQGGLVSAQNYQMANPAQEKCDFQH
jgi:hypothetical protein